MWLWLLKHIEEILEYLEENGYENVKYLTNYDYSSAFIGVSTDNRAVYDFYKMVDWLIQEKICEDEFEAHNLIETHTIPALRYYGNDCPIIIKGL